MGRTVYKQIFYQGNSDWFRKLLVVMASFVMFFPQMSLAVEDHPPLRGLKHDGAGASGSEADSAGALADPQPVVPPAFPEMPNRMEPADPGVVPGQSNLRLQIDDFFDDRLSLKTTAPQLLIPVGKDKLPPIKLEATYTEALSLKDALREVRNNNLPIKISKTDLAESRYKYLGTYGGFVPSMSLNYTPQKVWSGSVESQSDPLFITILYPVFLGGGAIFNTLEKYHSMKAARSGYYSSINDALLDAYLKYYDLVFNWALLDLRAKSLEVARTQLVINQDLKSAGQGTEFEVLQSKTLYSLEKQRLVRQEVELRRSALQLSVILNKSMIHGLIPSETEINRKPLVEPAQSPELLTALAVENRPELARFEELRLAARNAARAAFSPLLPRAAFFTNNSINAGAGSSIIIPTGSGSASGGITTDSTSGRGASSNSFAGGFILNWLIAGAGINDAGNVMAAKMRARRAMLEGREELLRISAEVRDAYLDTRAAETEIDVTSDAVASATEQLRMSNLRLTHQIGTNLEVIQSQRDYIDAVSRRIEAFVSYKKSQARLLHATGLISIDSLTAERPQSFQLKRGKK